jgi:predicted Zn-dependent protease
VKQPCRRFAARCFAAALSFAFLLVGSAAPVRADEHEDDALLGQKVYDDLKSKLKIVENSQYLPVLRRVGAKIALAAQPHWFNERFYVVRGNEINAFSAPGGFVFVDEGLLRALNGVDELANVLGHETAHLVLGHVQGKIRQEERKNVILGVGSLIVNKNSKGAVKTLGTAAIMGNYTFLNFTRQQEYAADELGAKLAAKAGYNPWGTVWFFKELERLVGDAGYEQYVQQHPSTSDRIDKVEQYLRDNATDYQRWKNNPPATTSLPVNG